MRYLIIVCILVAAGCDSQELGKTIGQEVTEFAEGVGSGADSGLKVEVSVTEEFTAKGLKVSVAKRGAVGGGAFESGVINKKVEVYVLSTTPCIVEMRMQVYDKEKREIGRASEIVKFGEDDAQYVDFVFDKRVDTNLIEAYQLTVARELSEEEHKKADEERRKQEGEAGKEAVEEL